MNKTKITNIAFYTLSVVIILSAIFLRVWKLDNIPPGIQYDEAYNGINALQAEETRDYKVFYPENFGREGFHLNITSLFVELFGVHNFSLRLANALWGSLAVIGFYFLLRELKFRRLSILLGTFLIAFSFWHLNFSRTAYRAIMVPMLITWASYFFFKGIHSKKSKGWFFAASGAVMGLGLHTYIAFRVAPIIIILLALSFAVTKKDFIRKYWKNALIFIFSAFIVALPIVVYFLGHRNDFSSRTDAVSIFNAPNMTFFQALGKSLSAHLGAFFVDGDTNWRHNYNGQPIIPVAWSVLLVIGFIFSLSEIVKTIFHLIKWKINKEENKQAFKTTKRFHISVLAQSIFWVMLIPGVLSIEGIPHSLRIIGTIPGVFLLCALPLEYIIDLYERLQKSTTLSLKPWRWNILRTSIIGLTFIILFSGLIQTYIYFEVWAKDVRTSGAFERKLYDLGILVKDLPIRQNNYIVTTSSIAVSDDGKNTSLKTTEYIGWPNIKNFTFMKPLDARFSVECENAQIIFQESDQWLRNQFKDRCSNLTEEELKPKDGMYTFWVLR